VPLPSWESSGSSLYPSSPWDWVSALGTNLPPPALNRGLWRGVPMRKSGWTPSIVPTGDDQSIYLVVDDLGRFGRSGAKPTLTTLICRPLSRTCSQANIPTRSACSASTPLKDGHGTYPTTSPRNCDGAATCNCATCRATSWILSKGMRTAAGGNWRCDWSD
jgi:hypothetical protein